MANAKVTKEFNGVLDGETQTRPIKKGDIISGELAKVALANKWAVPFKGKVATENKDAGNAPENKSAGDSEGN